MRDLQRVDLLPTSRGCAFLDFHFAPVGPPLRYSPLLSMCANVDLT